MNQRKFMLAIVGLCASFAPYASASAADAKPASEQGSKVQEGQASWYGPGFHGRRTASGERFDTNAMTAAAVRQPGAGGEQAYRRFRGRAHQRPWPLCQGARDRSLPCLGRSARDLGRGNGRAVGALIAWRTTAEAPGRRASAREMRVQPSGWPALA